MFLDKVSIECTVQIKLRIEYQINDQCEVGEGVVYVCLCDQNALGNEWSKQKGVKRSMQ